MILKEPTVARAESALPLAIAGLAIVAAVVAASLGTSAAEALVVWSPSSLVAGAFALAFLATAFAAVVRHRHSGAVLVAMAALSLIALLYAPAFAFGGPVHRAPESVLCVGHVAVCWNSLNAAFKVQACIFLAALGLAVLARTSSAD